MPYLEWKQKHAVLVHVSLNANELLLPAPFSQYALLLQLVSQILYSVQILDFWRTYAERGGGGVCGRDNAAVCVSLRPNRAR